VRTVLSDHTDQSHPVHVALHGCNVGGDLRPVEVGIGLRVRTGARWIDLQPVGSSTQLIAGLGIGVTTST
jgi:hypothetical protein